MWICGSVALNRVASVGWSIITALSYNNCSQQFLKGEIRLSGDFSVLQDSKQRRVSLWNLEEETKSPSGVYTPCLFPKKIRLFISR